MILQISETIKQRIIDYANKNQVGVSFRANDNISQFIKDDELDLLQNEVEGRMKDLLESLVIDIENDHNTQETAKRVAKMFVRETFAGRYYKAPSITAFPNVGYDQLYMTGPITIRSTCAHHFQNIKGKCWIGVFPGENVIG